MTTIADERIVLIRLKVERAKKHITDLEGALRSFFDSCPYEIATKRDPHTRKLIYYISRVSPIPTSIALITGDVIQNLRSALDHLAQQLYLVGIGEAHGIGRHVYFLIERDAAEYKSRLPGKIKGMRQDAIDALTAIEPFHGGKGHDLWVLHTLNNIDKHRLLVTVGSSFQSVNLGAHARAMMQNASGRDVRIPDIFIRPADNLCPLKVGDELFTDLPDAEVKEKMDFRFDVALSESGVIDNKPLLQTLQNFAELVDHIILAFRSSLA